MGSNEKALLVRQPSGTNSNNVSIDIERYSSQSSYSSTESNLSDSNTQIQPYFKTSLPRELLICIVSCYFGVYSPTSFWRPMLGIYMTPIPYQVLKSGDVVLDLELNNEYIKDVTIGSNLLKQTSFTLPLIILIIFTQLAPQCPVKYFDTHAAVCVLLLSIGLCEFTTQMAKMYVGRLRPNFYQFCGFDPATLTCTASEHDIMESRSSFPSGHSSLSTAGMSVLVLFFLGRAGIGSFKSKNAKGRTFGKRRVAAVLSLTPLAWSTFVACSRLVDHWHHPSDIIAGICLGLFFPSVIYHLWYPTVVSSQAGVPLSCVAGTKPTSADKDFA
jgi:membrane-associated phospholipid phosphatase